VRVSDGGSYICLARNDLGSSDEITASVDVRYPARNVRTVPADFLDLEVRLRRSSSFPVAQWTRVKPFCWKGVLDEGGRQAEQQMITEEVFFVRVG
jgi:hypothetical protein